MSASEEIRYDISKCRDRLLEDLGDYKFRLSRNMEWDAANSIELLIGRIYDAFRDWHDEADPGCDVPSSRS